MSAKDSAAYTLFSMYALFKQNLVYYYIPPFRYMNYWRFLLGIQKA